MKNSNIVCLFTELNNNHIRYCSFKSNEHLNEGLLGNTDLDILISYIDYMNASKILKKEHFVQVEPVGIGSYPNIVNWYGLDYETGKLIHIHLHFELMSGKSLVKEYCLPWKDYFLDNTVIDGSTSIKCVIPVLEYILLCTRMMIKRNIRPLKVTIAEDTIKELDFLLQKVNCDDLYDWAKILFPNLDAKLFSNTIYNILNCKKSQFLWLYDFIKLELKGAQRVPETVAFLRSYLNRATRKVSRDINRFTNTTLPLKKRFITQGISVAFVGIDGSGKSTISKQISDWLGREFDTKSYYAGAGDGKKDFLSSIFLKIYGKYVNRILNENHNGSTIIECTDNNNSKLSFKRKIKGIGSSIAYTRILASNIRHLKEAKSLTSKGLVCLMDRYPQNSVPFVHDGAKVRKYDTGRGIIHYYSERERQYLEAIKKSSFDLVIKLRVTGETSYKRKPQESLTSLKHKEKTLESVNYDALETIIIDAEKNLEEVLLNVKQIIWDRLSMK